MAESEPPLRGVEVRGSVRFVEEGVTEIAGRIASRYVDDATAVAYVETTRGADVIIRLEPGSLRAWDFADDFGGA